MMVPSHLNMSAIVSLLLASLTSALKIVWELENYGDWNLPFAKLVEIQGREGGNHYHNLALDSYKMRVDPSAVFSVLFLEPAFFTDYNESDLVVMDYTFLGNFPQVVYRGVWTDVSIKIRHNRGVEGPSETSNVDFTIFVAIGTPPEYGLSGVLSVCVIPA